MIPNLLNTKNSRIFLQPISLDKKKKKKSNTIYELNIAVHQLFLDIKKKKKNKKSNLYTQTHTEEISKRLL